MREFKTDDIKITVNGLTRKDFKKHDLGKYGYDFFMGVTPLPEGVDQETHVYKFIEAALHPDDRKKLESLTPRQTAKLYQDCIKETYGAEDEEKNLSTPGTD